MILLIPAYKITQSKPGDQAADHLSNPVFRERLSCVCILQPVICQRGVHDLHSFISLRTVRRLILSTFGLSVALVSAAAAPQPPCKNSPKLMGACYVVHGRATYGNGTPALRIWLVGTKRMLGVTADKIADDSDDPIVPKQLVFDPSKKAFGDFEVCPFPPERSG
jgi:hypothetical protein